ncbi:T9SS type A sorting domain-containing protein [Flavobacterium sp.]|uniref:beta strand repeat-containing protein n=1 Tax=Flavobacterium sp. TaxID=239 RepID=UPI00286B6DDB|nr:T9SS type A sorting domain-containing protein [Flavobacterium sp.]
MKTKLIYCLFVSMFFGMFQSSAQSCIGFTTFTQGGWGTQCHGGNPGCYRDANFDAAFPDGIRIGNETNSITLTSSMAVRNFLPSGTTPRALNSGALVDPGQTYRNVLAGQLVALTLNVGFDVYDANFSSNTLLLGDLSILSGPFQGMTVSQFLVVANATIGGAVTGYSPSQVNSTASTINEYFDGGHSGSGFLDCVTCPNCLRFDYVITSFNGTCFGQSTGSITITTSGGTAPYSYYLNNVLIQTTNDATYTFTGLTAGSYTVTVNDGAGNSGSSDPTVTITGPTSALALTATSTNGNCQSNIGTATVTATGGTAPYTILWSNGSTSFTVYDLAAGTYTAVVTDANGCTANVSQTIQSSGLVAANVISNITCFAGNNGSITTTVTEGTAPYTILWSNGSTSFTINNLVAGTYTAVVTDANGCTANVSATITQALLLSNTNVFTNATCCTGNNGMATATPLGGTAPYTILWSNGSTAFSLDSLVAGTYTYVITDANGCQTNGMVTIQAVPTLTSTYVSTSPSCTESNGSVTVTATGGTVPYTILWSNGSTAFELNNLAGGTYTYTVTDANGCQTNGTVLIQAVSTIATTYDSAPPTCLGNNGFITVTTTGGTSPYTILWSNGSTAFTIDTLADGTYTYTVTDASGCQTNGLVTLAAPVNCSRFDFIIISTNVLCYGQNTGSITITPSGGTAPYSYYLNSVLIATTNNASYTFTGLAAGGYTVSVNDSIGNSGSSDPTITITQSPELVTTVAHTDANCNGGTGTATVTATGGTAPYTILWSNGSTDFTLANLAAGTYTYTVTDANGCQTQGTVTITSLQTLVASATSTNVTCFGGTNGSVTATATLGTAPYTILWSNGGTTFTINNLAAGTYTAVVTDANGCTVNVSATVTQPTTVLSSTNTSVNATCCTGNNGTANVTPIGGTAPYTILWSNGSTTFSLDNLVAGTYTYVVTDANGCTTNGSVLIRAVPILASTLVTTPATCAGNDASVTVTATGGTMPYTILWSNGSTTFTLANLAAGTYTYTVTDANGCQTNGTVTITATPVLVASATSTNVNCFAGTNGSATVTATGGTAPYTILWSNGSTTFTVNNLLAGTYTAVVTDARGCTSNVSVTITQPAMALASTNTTTNVSCFAGTNGSVTVTATGGTAPYTILWSNGGTTFTANNLAAGTYTAVITDARGCTSNVSVTITQPAMALASTNTTTSVSCFAGTNGSVTVTATGGTAPYTILWSNGGTTFTANNLAAGTYTAVITDARGCTSNVSVTITQPAMALASTNTTTNVSCFGGTTGSTTVTATGGTAPYTILWSNGGTTFTANNLAAGTYTAVITDARGCTSNVSVTITQPTALVASTTQTNVSCFAGTNGSVTATVTGGTSPYTILWSNGSTSFTLTNLLAGTYTGVITSANGCTATVSATVTQPTALVATATHTNVSCFAGTNGSVTATVTGGTAPYTILWSNGSTTFTVNNLSAGTYTAVITSANGCTANVSTTITQPATALAITMSQTPITTSGGYGTATATVTGGTGPYTYSWNSTPIQTTQTASLQVGWYTVTVTDANGCIITGEVVLLFGNCVGFKTVSNSGYNANCVGDSASCYLNTNFATSFPNGIVVGSGTRYLKFTSAEAIKNFLPSDSAAKTLNLGTILNPSSSAYNNGLAAQVLTTRLNIAFGRNADFSSNELSLGDLYITSGTFEGMKVSQVLTIANTLLGKGNSKYTMTEVNNALIAINGNYEAGADQQFLRCTGSSTVTNTKPDTALLSYKVYPNPVKDLATIEYTLNNDSSVSIELYNVTGQLINTIFNGNAEAGQKQSVSFNADGMKSGVYFFKLTTNNNVVTKSVIISQQ